MPATNATNERSFKVKMAQTRLNSLMFLHVHVHKEHIDNFDIPDVCDDFNFSEHRQGIFKGRRDLLRDSEISHFIQGEFGINLCRKLDLQFNFWGNGITSMSFLFGGI